MIYQNENESDEMKECLKRIQENQPKYEDDGEMVYGDQGIVGDQVSF